MEWVYGFLVGFCPVFLLLSIAGLYSRSSAPRHDFWWTDLRHRLKSASRFVHDPKVDPSFTHARVYAYARQRLIKHHRAEISP